MAQLPDSLSDDELQLPDSVDLPDVEFINRYKAYDTSVTDTHGRQSGSWFNPLNGRYYKDDQAFCSVDSTSVVGGLDVNCAYADCNGHTTVEVGNTVQKTCSECGEKQMGRWQWGSDNTGSDNTGSDNTKPERHERHGEIAEQTTEFRDEMATEMARLTDAGAGTVPALDYLMCSIGEIPYQEWAEARGVKEQTVKQNMNRVAESIGEQVTYYSTQE